MVAAETFTGLGSGFPMSVPQFPQPKLTRWPEQLEEESTSALHLSRPTSCDGLIRGGDGGQHFTCQWIRYGTRQDASSGAGYLIKTMDAPRALKVKFTHQSLPLSSVIIFPRHLKLIKSSHHARSHPPGPRQTTDPA